MNNRQFNGVFIASYTFIYKGIRTNNAGPVIHLWNYFKRRAKVLYLLEQPLPGSDTLDTILTIIRNGKTEKAIRKNFFFSTTPQERLDSNKTYMKLKLRDIVSNFYFMLKYFTALKKQKIELFVGLESLNAICGIIMRKIGLVDKVVYYIFDWAPDRYPNPVINKLYIWLDKIATYYSDYTWNITYTIGEARKNILGYDQSKMSPQLYVPYCVNFNERNILSEEAVDDNLLIYSGGLIEENGPHLLLDAYKLVMQRFPDSKLLIIGGGGMESELRRFIIDNSMDNNVTITGYIAEEGKVLELQRRGVLGIAPYPIVKGSRKPFGDVIKIRMYFASGLVTVSTPVPPVSKEIEEERLGYRTKDDNPEEIAYGICMFLEDKRLLFEYRENVIKKAKIGNWEDNYNRAIRAMQPSMS